MGLWEFGLNFSLHVQLFENHIAILLPNIQLFCKVFLCELLVKRIACCICVTCLLILKYGSPLRVPTNFKHRHFFLHVAGPLVLYLRAFSILSSLIQLS